MDFTQEQKAAIFTHDKNLIVVAGAGSGKTRVLVERYMALLEAHSELSVSGLVAITFTRKAAREMRDRLRQTFSQRIQQTQSEAARVRWQEQESLLDGAKIGTIHSLCTRILRANPAEVGVDPLFEVLEETDASLLKKEAVEQSLIRLKEIEAAVPLLLRYGVEKARRTLLQFVEYSKAGEFISSLAQFDSPEHLADYRRSQADAMLTEKIAELRESSDFQKALTWITPEQLPPGDKLAAIWEVVLLEEKSRFLQGSIAEFFAALQHLMEVIKLTVGSAKSWGSKEAVEEAKAHLRYLRDEVAKEWLKKYEWATYPPEVDDEIARMLFLWRDAIGLTSEIYQALKAERAVMDFDDLETRTRQLLEQYPAVARRYAEKEIRHIMVDEFQDTNQAQRSIIYQLSGIGNDDNLPDTPGKLFVVGDPKQSIYRFRGAEVEVFNQVRDEIVTAGGEALTLSESFRTHQNLVDNFNALFAGLLKPANADRAQGCEVEAGKPMQSFRPSESDIDPHQIPVELMIFQSDLSTDDVRRHEARAIARRIHDMKEQEVPVWDKEENRYRPFEYGDVAILFRTQLHLEGYEEIFKAEGLPYVTVAGRGYYDRSEVMDLLNLLSALYSSADELALAAVLRSPMFGLSDETLFALRLLKDDNNKILPLWDAVQIENPAHIPDDDVQPLNFAREVLAELKAVSGRVTVAELLDMALDLTAYDALLTGLPDGDRRRGNVDKLLEIARTSGRVMPGAFLAYIHELKVVEVREGEASVESSGAVKIMTVHASKGLEFPLVVLPDSSWQRQSNRKPEVVFSSEMGASCLLPDREDEGQTWIPFSYQQTQEQAQFCDIAEHKRLLYVGMTRAGDYVLMSGQMGKKKIRENSWLAMVCDEWNLEPGMLEAQQPVQSYSFSWGMITVRFYVPDEPVEAGQLDNPQTGWQQLTDIRESGKKGHAPPLLRPILVDRLAPARHLSVSQLEKLGSIPAYRPPEEGRREFRRSVYYDIPRPVLPVIDRPVNEQRMLRRVIGNMVHRILMVSLQANDSHEDFWSEKSWERMLKVYAWEEGIHEDDTLRVVVSEGYWLLRQYDMPEAVRHAERKFGEIPFLFRTDNRIIHGQIDLLYQYQGTWHVLDYKTAPVKAGWASEHAKRYHFQVGAYARAVEARTGTPPEVSLYYLHPGVHVQVPQPDWAAALDSLDMEIEKALLEEDE